MKKLIITVLSFAFCAYSFATWKVEKYTDPMTDCTYYNVVTIGNQIESFGIPYNPVLCVRVHPVKYNHAEDKMTYTNEVFFAIDTDALRRGANKVTVRHDKEQAQDTIVNSSIDRHAGFFMDAISRHKKLLTTDRLLIRFVTSLNQVQLATFETSGLKDALKSVKELYKETLPPLQEWKPPQQSDTTEPPEQEAPPKVLNVTCPKCHGSGSVDAWRLCSSCNGSTRGCASCRNSGWTGHTKATGECPKCKGFGTIKPPSKLR